MYGAVVGSYDKLFSRVSNVFPNTSSTAGISRTPKNSSIALVSRFGNFGSSAIEPDVELINQQFHLDQAARRSTHTRAALELTRDSSSIGSNNGSDVDWSCLERSSKSGIQLSDLAASSAEQI